MKKLFIILCLIFLSVSCSNPNIIVGDDMVVTYVGRVPEQSYQTLYKVQVRSLNKGAGSMTLNGQYLYYYTNTLYTVGDTLIISKKQ